MFFKRNRKDRIFKPFKLNTALLVLILVGGVFSINIEDVSAANTGYRPFSSQAAVTSSAGDNNGYESSPLNAQADGGGFATDLNSGASANSTTCGTGSDKHRWTFNDATINAISSGAVIDGIVLRMDIWTDSYTGATATFWGGRVSYDGGTSWTSIKQTATCSSAACEAEQTFLLGGSTDTWGRTWSPSELKSGNLIVETCNMDVGDANGARDHYLDYLALDVHYTEATTQTISGTVYATDGTTPLANKTVNIRVNGGSTIYTGETNGSGAYSIANVAANSGAILSIYLDGETEDANTITTAAGSNLTGVDLYQNTVIVRSDDGTSITNAEIVASGYDSTDDADVLFTFSSNVISLTSGASLLVWTGDTYAPGANVNVTSGNVTVAGTFTLTSSTLKLTTGRILSTGGTMTGGTVQLVGNTQIASNFTFTALQLGDDSTVGTTTAESNFTVNNLTVNNNHTLNASTYTMTVTAGGAFQGFYIDASGVFTAGQSTVKYTNGAVFASTTYYNVECAGTASCQPAASTTYNVSNNLIISSGTVGEFSSVASSTFVVGGNVTIALGATFNAPDTLRVAGSFTNSGTFTHSSSAVEFNGSGTQTITPGGSSFNTVTFNGSGTYVLAGSMTVLGNATLSSGSLDLAGNTLSVSGTMAASGSSKLYMDTSGDVLKIGTALTFTGSAWLVTSDVATTPKITTTGVVGTNFYSVTFTGGDIRIDEMTFESVNASGIVVGSGATVTNFNYVTLSSFEKNGSDIMLNITDQTETLLNWVFPDDTSRNINVKANGSGTITMQNATGAFSGETYDSDNGGTVTWGVFVSVSGTLYSDAGTTPVNCSSANRTIAVSVAGGAVTTATCSAVGGTYTVSSLQMEVGDIVTVFVDNHANNAVTVLRTNSSSSNLTSVDLYEGHVVLRDEDSTPITIANLADYDSVDQNGDIPFTVSGTNLDVSGAVLYINGGDTFTPGGNLTLDDLYISSGASLVAGSGQNHTISGSWTNAGTFTASTSTITFDSGAAETITNGGSSFNNVVFNGVGSWTLQDAMTVVGDVTVVAGLLDLDTRSLTVEGGDITGAGTINQIGGTTTVEGTGSITQSAGAYSFHNLTVGDGVATATTTVSGTIEVINDLSVSANHTLQGAGDVSVIGNISGSGTVTMSGGSFTQSIATTGKTFGGSNAWTFNDLTFSSTSGTPAVNASGSGAVNVVGTLTIATNTTLQAGARTWTLSNPNSVKPFVVSGTFTPNTSTVVLSGDYNDGNVTIDDVTYYNLTLGGATAENFDAEGSTTVQNTLTVNAGAKLLGTDNWAVNGTVTGGGEISLTGGTFTQRVATNQSFGATNDQNNSWSFNNLKFENSTGSTTTITVPSGANSAIVVNGTVTIGNSSDTATTLFDVNTNDRVLDFGSVVVTSRGSLSASSSAVMYVSGNFTNDGTFSNNSGTVTFDGSGTGLTITGVDDDNNDFYNVVFNGTGSWDLTGVDLVVVNNFTVTDGVITSPSILYVGGSIDINDTFTHNNGIIILTATTSGKTLDFGGNDLYALWLGGLNGGWTVTGNELVVSYLSVQRGNLNATVDITVLNAVQGVLGSIGEIDITYPGVNFEVRTNVDSTFGANYNDTTWTFQNLVFSNSGALNTDIVYTTSFSAGSIVTVNGTLTVGRDTDTNFSETDLVLGSETWVFSGTDTIDTQGKFAMGYIDFGSTNVKFSGTTTSSVPILNYNNVEFNGGGTYNLTTVNGYAEDTILGNFTVTSGSVDNGTNDASLFVTGDFTIASGATFIGGLQVQGDWINNGTFTHGGRTVYLTQSVVGSTTTDVIGNSITKFYNLRISPNGKTVRFKAGQEVWFENSVYAQGTVDSGSRIIIRSTSDTAAGLGDQWLMNLGATATTDLTWVVVVNGGCATGNVGVVQGRSHLLNGGNNNSACWPFVNIGIQFEFAPGDGNGGGTAVSGGGGGGGSNGGSTEGSGDAEGSDGGGTPVDGGGGGGGTTPSP